MLLRPHHSQGLSFGPLAPMACSHPHPSPFPLRWQADVFALFSALVSKSARPARVGSALQQIISPDAAIASPSYPLSSSLTPSWPWGGTPHLTEQASASGGHSQERIMGGGSYEADPVVGTEEAEERVSRELMRCCVCLEYLGMTEAMVVVFFCTHSYHLTCLQSALAPVPAIEKNKSLRGKESDGGWKGSVGLTSPRAVKSGEMLWISLYGERGTETRVLPRHCSGGNELESTSGFHSPDDSEAGGHDMVDKDLVLSNKEGGMERVNRVHASKEKDEVRHVPNMLSCVLCRGSEGAQNRGQNGLLRSGSIDKMA